MKPELQAVGAERSMAKQRTKAEETAKNAAKVAREGHQITNRSRLDLEIRFAKTQQLAVATATMTLLGAILGIGHLLKPPTNGARADSLAYERRIQKCRGLRGGKREQRSRECERN